MTALTPFQYGAHEVRTLSVDDEPWFVLADLCRILDISNARNVASRLADDMKGVRSVDTPGGVQQMTTVSEAGMYSVVMRSDKPQSEPFRRWVTSDVLPAIRKHGGYLTPAAVEEALADPDTIIRLATSLKEERAARAELEAQRTADAPKVLFADAVSTSQSTILVGDLAKILRGNGVDIGATRLFAVLRETGYLINRKGTDWNSPTQKAMDLGLFRIKETAVTHSDGHVTVNKTPKVTGKGQTYFVERFLSGRIPAAA
ncbi:phage antirepressor [Brachybacterium sp.]|uniref:phage antirepressor n=1 Tax=Brachybacterium sp. TaxID=1891286 RepID=UPI002ED42617